MTRRVIVFDTTLRDGEQAPGNSLSIEEKVRVARQLEVLGVDVIEAGFPASSETDFRSVQEIAAQVRGPVIAALARCTERDIDLAGEAIRGAARGRIHVFLSTSDLHLKAKLRMTREEAVEKIRESVRRAKSFTEDVEWSAEDASRTGLEFLCQCVGVAIERGCHHHQPSRHGRLRDTRGVRYDVPRRAAAGARIGGDRSQRALPRRSRPGGGQLARGNQRGRGAGRMHHQRHR